MSNRSRRAAGVVLVVVGMGVLGVGTSAAAAGGGIASQTMAGYVDTNAPPTGFTSFSAQIVVPHVKCSSTAGKEAQASLSAVGDDPATGLWGGYAGGACSTTGVVTYGAGAVCAGVTTAPGGTVDPGDVITTSVSSTSVSVKDTTQGWSVGCVSGLQLLGIFYVLSESGGVTLANFGKVSYSNLTVDGKALFANGAALYRLVDAKNRTMAKVKVPLSSKNQTSFVLKWVAAS